MHRVRTFWSVALVIAVSVMLTPARGSAQAPANDECTGATVVSSLPFQASQDTRLATPNATDPNLTCADAGGGKTVWYVYTAATTQYITFSSRGSTPSDYDVAMGLLTGTCGNLTLVACNDDIESGIVRASEIIYKVSAGTTYYIHVAEWKGGGPSGGVPTGGDLVFSVSVSDIRLYRGPKSATVASGLVRDTGPASTLAPLFDPIPKPIRNKPPVQLIPAPEGVTPPSGPEGSNYVDLGTERSVSALATQPVVFENFEGIPQTNSIPPDPDVAVGPNHVMAVVNTSFRIWDKKGNILKTITAQQWFQPLFGSSRTAAPFDCQIVYDHFDNRWVMTWDDVQDTSAAWLELAVSDDSNPMGTWYIWALPSNQIGDSAVAIWDDYPQLGFDSEALYVTGRGWGLVGNFRYTRIHIIGKQQLYANTAGPVTWTDLWDMRDPVNMERAPDGFQATVMYGTPGVHYFVNPSPFEPGTYFTLWTLSNPLTNPTLTAQNIPVVQYRSAPNANQLGGSTILVEAGGSRLRAQPVYRDSSLWFVHSVASGTGNAYSAIRYVRLNPHTKVVQEDVAAGSDGSWHYYTALMVDTAKNILVTFTRSGVTEYPGAFVVGRKSTDPPGFSPSIALRTGQANYVKDFGSGRNRWGDYNGIGLDPSDPMAMWVQTEYATSPSSTWANRIAKVKLGPLPGAFLQLDKESIDYGKVEVGLLGDTTTVTIVNSGLDTLVISGLALPGANFPVLSLPTLPLKLPTFAQTSLQVAFTPVEGGQLLDSLVIQSNDVNASERSILLSGKGVVITPAQPGLLYAAQGLSPFTLATLNTSTGDPTAIGLVAAGELMGLAIHPTTREMYGTYTRPPSTFLYRLSSADAETRLAATVPVPNMRAIAFASDGTLYGATTGGRLLRVSLPSGDTSIVGTATGIVYSSLAFNPISGELWASVRPTSGTARDRIYKVNTANGDTTLVGATGLGVLTAHIAFDPAGRLYAVATPGTASSQLYVLDTTTAAATLVGSTGLTSVNGIVIRTDSTVVSVEERENEPLPSSYALEQNYPNPFNPTTLIQYALPQPSRVRLTIFNMLGQEVTSLVDAVQAAGRHSATWNGTGRGGTSVATGVYLYRLEASPVGGSVAPGSQNGYIETRKMILVK